MIAVTVHNWAGGETSAAWAAVLDVAQRLDDTDYRLRALRGLWVCNLNSSELAEGSTDPAACDDR
jgi:hypothetical protein